MAGTKISDLTALAGADVAATDVLPIVDTSAVATKKITAPELKAYMSNSPTLVTPALGTPASGTLTNCTGLPVAGGGTGATTASAARTNLSAAALAQTDFIAGVIDTPEDQDYKLVVKLPYAITITDTTTIAASGSCTATFKINASALGGTANSVSTTEQSQSHASSNTASAGDDIVVTISANSSCDRMSFTITFTRTLS